MTSFLLIISFLLHIITLSGLFFLLKQLQGKNDETSSEIPNLLESYLEEIKAENKRLQDEISANHIVKKENRLDPSPNKDRDLDQHMQIIETKQDTVEGRIEENDDKYVASKLDTMNDEVQASLQARILQLHQTGLSEEEIARKLNCGKTEVALTIKLHGKK
ncbi:hypothetical protein GMD78_16070 [Ornithinibacillus sp. L9]|uniref:Coupling factor for flagellin transcription and translation n=1 Tax=Ornithinibacillus caprae TaxID=2678566 RepID=A0A6N8FP34_9BACI|nr:hypothetical protein [Ornithinibacillus caprae]MUK89887.1 hypothetical protein [Ornithinibacillus caprae]